MQVQTLAAQLLFSTVRIETDTPQGISTGTAFIFGYTHLDNQFLFLVTNKHVINNSTNGRFFFTLSNGDEPLVGQRFDVNVRDFESHWYGHPKNNVDIAVMPLVPILQEIERMGKQIFFRAITHDLIPSDEQISELNTIEELLFIGYPNGIFDSKNLMPVTRRGLTATPLQVDYEGEPIFLMDASVFPGSSGSPVLIVNEGGFASRGGFSIGNRIHFLGIIASVVIREEFGKIDFVSIPTSQIPIIKTQQMIDLGVAYKSSAVLETVIEFLKQNNAV
jgi:V8-like Glu-specific endopeptidase